MQIEAFDSRTVNITDYKLKSNTLAKVVISFTGDFTSEELTNALCAKLNNLARPVKASFKQIKPGVAVGFLRANREVLAMPTTRELTANYRLMASNIYMDNSDKSLWEVKKGAAGKYLARQGQEDLTALVESTVQRRADVPGLRHIAIAAASKHELVAFVADDGSMDYGFALQGNETAVKVISMSRHIPVVANYDQVVSMNAISIPASMHKQVMAVLSDKEKKDEIAYWQKLYGWDPEYFRKVVDQVNQGTVM